MQQKIKQAVSLARNNAPYLRQLLDEFPDIPDSLLTQDIEPLFESFLVQVDEAQNCVDMDSVMTHLRVQKRRVHLFIALLDIARIWDWVAVTKAMTQLADRALAQALAFAAKEADLTGSLDNPVPGLFVLALGKYGASELNYSSDIDIIVFFDPDYLKLPEDKPAEKTLIRLVQKMVKLLDYLDGDGYVFRTDLRLRPDPRSNAIIISTRTAERYYETLGQNWERAAMIKARLCAGDKAAGQVFMDTILRPFIWRKNLDYAAIDDIAAMKRQILAVGKHGKIKAAGHHLKLGRGGIREVEFYAQTQQLILGGRHKELRQIRTDGALLALNAHGHIPKDICEALLKAYAILRDLEHRVQMIDDAQTHISPVDDAQRLCLARLAGFDDLTRFDDYLENTLMQVQNIYQALYPEKESLASDVGSLVFTGVEADPETLHTLTTLGYTRQADVWRQMANWLGGRVMATRTERARESLTRLAPRIIKACADTGLADIAFFNFADFFTKLRSGISLLALFEGRPEFLESLISIMTQAPRLADVLARQPSTIDSMIEPDFYNIRAETLASSYSSGVSFEDLETAMNAIRRAVREDHFRVSAAVLTHTLAPLNAPPLFTQIADSAIAGMVPAVIADIERKLDNPGGGFVVIALGKAGGAEMSVTSDLDLMAVYVPAKDPAEGTHNYYTKLTQRLISALSVATHEGTLFEVDMALRPSGGSGPITVSLSAFDSYYDKNAWTWEFMALSRARIVYASNPQTRNIIEGRLTAQLTRARDKDIICKDVKDMRARLLRDKGPRSMWDIKRVSGGVTDIEFYVQYLQLVHGAKHPECLHVNTRTALDRLNGLKFVTDADHHVLSVASEFFTLMRQYLSICMDGLYDPNKAPNCVTRGLLDMFECKSNEGFERKYKGVCEGVKSVCGRLFN